MDANSFLVISSIRIHFYSSNVNLRMWRVFRLYRTLLSHTWTDIASICFLLLSAYTFLLSAQRAPSPHRKSLRQSRFRVSCFRVQGKSLHPYLLICVFQRSFFTLTAKTFLIHSINNSKHTCNSKKYLFSFFSNNFSRWQLRELFYTGSRRKAKIGGYYFAK